MKALLLILVSSALLFGSTKTQNKLEISLEAKALNKSKAREEKLSKRAQKREEKQKQREEKRENLHKKLSQKAYNRATALESTGK